MVDKESIGNDIVNNDIQKSSIYLLCDEAENELPFIMTGTGSFVANDNYYVERAQIKDMFLVLYTIEGTGIVGDSRNSIRLKEGCATIINLHKYHNYYVDPRLKKWRFKWIRFRSDFGDIYEKKINKNALTSIFIEDSQFENYFNYSMKIMKSQEMESEFELSLMVHNILFALCKKSEKNMLTKEEKGEELLECSRCKIIKRSGEKISIDELAESCFMTKSAFIRKFKKHYHITPYAMIVKIRLKQAKFLLETTESSMNEIALQVGFGDQKNFSKQFQLNNNMTPTEYRNQFKQGKI